MWLTDSGIRIRRTPWTANRLSTTDAPPSGETPPVISLHLSGSNVSFMYNET
jgi:hypothetical protein